MNEEALVLGAMTDGRELLLDLDKLIGSHMGIVANSGGGKSGLLRKLLEVTHGHIQHIIIDSEDEFYTLRERHEYVIAGGDEGDTPATVDNAADLAIAALTHGFSLICQINDLGRDGANEFLDRFNAALIKAPRELWHPCLVVIDEAQRFDDMALRRLTEAGRKRGFTAIVATQRLPKLDANVRGDLNNWIMGRVGQSLDRRNMADQLGMRPKEADGLTRMEPRHFYAFGPALSRDPVLFRVGDVETTMVRPGQAKVQTPPPPEALREILSGLATAQPSEEEVQIDPASALASGKAAGEALAQRDSEIEMLKTQLAEERGNVAHLAGAIEKWNDQFHEVIDSHRAFLSKLFDVNNDLYGAMSQSGLRPIGRPRNATDMTIADMVDAKPVERQKTQSELTTRRTKPARKSPKAQDQEITGPQRHLLASVAWWESMGISHPIRAQVAAIAGWKITSGHLKNVSGSLKTLGLIEYPTAGSISLTDSGRRLAPKPDNSLSFHDQLRSTLTGPQTAVYDFLLMNGRQSREQLAIGLGWEPTSGHVKNVLGSMKTLDVVKYPERGFVDLTNWSRNNG